MRQKTKILGGILLTVGLLGAGTGHAFNFGNMMNPSKWMGGNDDYDDNYYGPGYGYRGYGPGYGGGPYGAPPGYGYGAPGYAPGYGYGGVPAYGGAPAYQAAPSVPAAAPDSGSDQEIERLKERIRVLENSTNQAPPAQAPSWDSHPAYRPVDETWGDPSSYQYR
jgi:hypothetical protein